MTAHYARITDQTESTLRGEKPSGGDRPHTPEPHHPRRRCLHFSAPHRCLRQNRGKLVARAQGRPHL
jgi:hypothetical protein